MNLLSSFANPQFISGSSYFIIFVIMFLEGPIITYIASFAASLNLLDIWVIIFLSIVGNVLGDLVFYGIGRFGKKMIIQKYFRNNHIKSETMLKIEHNLNTHTGKTMALVKLIPPLPAPGLIMAGIVEVPFWKFFLYSILITVPYSVAFATLGFYTGQAYNSFLWYFKNVQISVIITILLVLLLWFISRKIIKNVKGSNLPNNLKI